MKTHGLIGDIEGADVLYNQFIVVKSSNLEQQSADDRPSLIVFLEPSIDFRESFDRQFRIIDGVSLRINFGSDSGGMFVLDVDHAGAHDDD